ncbi:HAD family hydrolase [Vibrio cholerae]|uniref:HAD family hydrolase n=1 Tax=Vibrio cholerae TaxID=666 RepID=UPI0028DF98BB|nr:HAD-IA family hydrolase [Vibrio cholerae]MDT8796183.1 HAD-IA family hydrolase [Vibrio cholerae]MDT8829424.1 HAD-IA family hydrolase [Vibrio cholerae]
MKFNRIIITSDFLMTKESEQRNNVKWVYDLVNNVINIAVDVRVDEFVSIDSISNSVDVLSRINFFGLSNIPLFTSETQFYFDCSEINNDSLDYLKSCIGEETLIIGYELSEQTRKLLDGNGLHYIDIWLHPIRYMDDVLFAFNSNVKEFKDFLHGESLSESYYKLYASRLKVQSYKGFKRSQFYLEDNSALFVGQTLNDKAVLSNGKMLTVLDFKDAFEDLTKKHKRVYYSRHPFVKSGDEAVLDFIKSFKNVELIDKPAYEIITRDELVSVATVSSSVAMEAKYFDKKITYFFKPPVEIDITSSRGYYSIYNKFCSVKFWNGLLSPFFVSKDDSDINFFDGKDKLRDALSFYWGYRYIDKTESLKMTVGNLFNTRRNNEIERASTETEKFAQYINSPDIKVISFDIFDTLISRKTASPRDIFRILEKNMKKELGFSFSGFASIRIESEDKLRKEVLDQTGRQDITITEIYNKIKEVSGFSDEEIEKIKCLEFEYELEFIEPRRNGIELFNRAVRSDKIVVLTSDMYLEREQIEKILYSNNIEGFNNLYLSSELGIRKHEGDLFRFVLKDLSIKGSSMVHIGDNIHGDIESAKNFGINVIHTPRAIDIFKSSNRRCSNILISAYKNLNFQQNLIIGQYVNRFYDSIDTKSYEKSHFNGSSYELGYIALAPLIASFCTQIHNVATKNNIKHIAFLSRDGQVIKRAFDKLYPESNITTHYLSSSRRCTQVASIIRRSDIINIINKPVYSCQICDYLENRFGIQYDDIKIEVLLKYGLNTKSSMIGAKFDKEALKDIVLSHEDLILCGAKAEREEYINYVNSFNMGSHFAIVDIGYSGSLQKFFNEFVSDDIFGFYLATFSTSLSNISSQKSYSFISNLHNEKISIHGINTHRFMYENIVCSSEDSFVRIENGAKVFSPENDNIRKSLVNKIHDGVEDFCDDFKSVLRFNDDGLYLDPFNAELLLKDFMKFPSMKDVEMFVGIKFEDGFASSAIRYLVPPLNELSNLSLVNNCIWKEGVSAIKSSLTTSNIKNEVIKHNSSNSVASNSHTLTKDNGSKSKVIIFKSMLRKQKIFNALNYAINDRDVFKKKIKRFANRLK